MVLRADRLKGERMAIPDAGTRCWCWGQAAKADSACVCMRVMAAEAHYRATLEVAVGVAALVVVTQLEVDEEELLAAVVSGSICNV